jgi:hypothetical protein
MAQELAHINRHYGRYGDRNGEGALWYEFDPQSSVTPDLFDEGGRRWKPPIGMAMLWITETEDPEANSREGRRTQSTIRGAFSVQSARQSGLSDPTEYTRHLNDILLYNMRFYSINTYEVHGRVGQTDVVIGFSGIEIYPDEDMAYDLLPDLADPFATRRPFGYVNDLHERWNYPLPALRYHGLEGNVTTDDATSSGSAL